jgi:heme exporter protein B
MAALGCLFGALAAQTRARDLLLPVLALPLWLPLIVYGGRAIQVAMGAGGGYSDALGRLLALDILFVIVAALAAHFVLND